MTRPRWKVADVVHEVPPQPPAMPGLSEEQIRTVVMAVLDAEADRRGKTLDDVVMKAVATILTSFGVDDEDRGELRADFQHLRKWRKSVEQAQSYTFKAIITAIAGGLIGAAWLGFKTMLGKP